MTTRLADIKLTKKELWQLKKLLRLFFLGQLTGLPNLHSILIRFGIKSNNQQVKYNDICSKLSNSLLHSMFEFSFEQAVEGALKEFTNKHLCKWSRDLVTAVLDDSVFKQWLQHDHVKEAYEDCYGRFFSGQVGHIVYGFQEVTFGLVIEGIFYPMFFEAVKKKEVKKEEDNKKNTHGGKATIEVAKKLIHKWKLFVSKMKVIGLHLPNLYFSCDSGYSDVELSEDCLNSGLIYISVPKTNHLIEYDNAKIKISDWIKKTFIPLENDHKNAQKELKKEEETPFTFRFRAFYHCQNRVVTWLAFRLNGSNKVTLIYTTDKNIKGITLRRHWFQRTYIEQFFKILKHYLTIQASITITKHSFECKLLRFAFVALHIQLLVKTMKRKIPEAKLYGFGFIRMLLQSDAETLDLLHQEIYVKYS